MARVLRIVGAGKPIPVSGADELLPTARLLLDTGNECDVSPSMKIAGRERRIAFTMIWKNKPDDAELAAVQDYIEAEFRLGKPEAKFAGVRDPEALLAATEHFLSGKKPS